MGEPKPLQGGFLECLKEAAQEFPKRGVALDDVIVSTKNRTAFDKLHRQAGK